MMKTQTINLTIDAIDVEVEKGRTILEAAQSVGIRIPSLCHDRRLIPFGACRLCVVQEKGNSELLPSCFTPAKNGMAIITSSPKIIESRRVQLQFILLNHPMTCPRCEKEGECDLQDLVYQYGVKDISYPWDPITFPADPSSLLQRDSNKCILCGRCVRICDEVQGVGELSFAQRGIRSLIDTDFHRPIQCEFCGQCMDTCPVGAITSDRFDYRTKGWMLTEATTPCPYCGCGCSLTLGFTGGDVMRVFSDPVQGPSDGNLCVKGRFGWDIADSPDRLKTPLLRVDGALKEASWEEVLGFVVQRLEEIRDQSGPENIGAGVSSRLTNEEYFLVKKFFTQAMGIGQIALDGEGNDFGLAEGLSESLGFASSTTSIQEIRKADCLLVIGVDPAQSHPIVKNEIHLALHNNRAQLLSLGNDDIGLSRATQTSPPSPSSISLQTLPGRELSLLNGMIGVILTEGLENHDFIRDKTEGIEELRKRQEGYLESLSEEERLTVENAARYFAQSKRAMILIGSGYRSYSDSKKMAMACSNLALLTGHMGKAGSGIVLLLERCNSQGAIDMGVTSGTFGMKDLLKQGEDGKLKALYLVGKNPVLTPGILKNLELLVVQDLFMTEAAKEAHVVIPACSFIEKSGTYTNLERRVQKLASLRFPLAQSKSDFEIFLSLLRLSETPVPGDTPETVFQEICKSIPHYQNLRAGELWPKGTRILYADGFPIGKAKLMDLESPEPQPRPDPPSFFLIQRSSLFQSGKLHMRSENLKKVMDKPFLKMNIDDAQSLKINEGDILEISLPEGKTFRMRAETSSSPARGVMIATCPSPLLDEGRLSVVQIKKVSAE